MKKVFVFLIVCFAGMVLSAQQMHWTPVDEGLYSGSTAVIAVVKVNGVEQTSNQMELAVFCGNECRGTAMTSEFPVTHRYLALENVYGENGHQLTFKAYDHATNQELEMDPVVTITFTEDGSGSLFEPLELNFLATEPEPELHWTPVDEGLYSGSTAVIAVVKVDGVEQTSDQMELAVFCGEECRATTWTTEFPVTHRYLALENVYGENGHQLYFKAYDHATDQEFVDMNPEITVTFSDDGSGTLFEPLELNFVSSAVTQTINLVAGTNWFSANVEITFNDLKAALVAASPNAAITIKSQTQKATYNPSNGRWTGRLTTFDLSQMYKITVSAACEITFEGVRINPAEHPVTITPGANWIAYPLNTSKTPQEIFTGFAVAGDMVKSQSQKKQYNSNGRWTGQLGDLEPGKGYIYNSNATSDRTFVFPIFQKSYNINK
jgi:hypothetical protein